MGFAGADTLHLERGPCTLCQLHHASLTNVQVRVEQVFSQKKEKDKVVYNGFSAHWLALLAAAPSASSTRTAADTSAGEAKTGGMRNSEPACSGPVCVKAGDVPTRATQAPDDYDPARDLMRSLHFGESVADCRARSLPEVGDLLCIAALVNVWLAECAVAAEAGV